MGEPSPAPLDDPAWSRWAQTLATQDQSDARLVSVCRGLIGFCSSRGLQTSPEAALDPAVIESFVVSGCLGLTSSSRGTPIARRCIASSTTNPARASGEHLLLAQKRHGRTQSPSKLRF